MRSRIAGRLGFAIMASALFTALPDAAAAAITAQQLLQQADEARNPQLDYTMQVTVTSTRARGASRTATYQVFVKGRDHTVIQSLSPPQDRGRVLLMRERNLWAFLPTVSKPLRVSLRERLIGDVANGDLARANFTGDYTPAFLTGQHAATPPGLPREAIPLELTATAPDVTYGRVVLWIDLATSHPLYAEFFAVSGRSLKSCRYENYQMLAGRLRPTRLVMTDATAKAQQSVITYNEMIVAPLPEKMFTKDYMKKLME